MTLRRVMFLRLAFTSSLTVAMSTLAASVFVLTSSRSTTIRFERTRIEGLASDLGRLVPLGDRNGLVTFLRAAVRQDRFSRYAFVVRGERPLASTFQGEVPRELLVRSGQTETSFSYRDPGGAVLLDMAVPVPNTGTVLHVGLDRRAIDDSAQPFLIRIVLAGLAGLVLGLILAAWSARRVAREVTSLTAELAVATNDPSLGLATAPHPTGEEGKLIEIFERQTEERQRGMAELERQKRFLGDVVEALTHPFYVINASDYSIVLANSAACEHGIASGRCCYEVTHGRTTPCDGTDHPCPLEAVRATGEPVIIEHRHINPDGKRRIVEIRGYPILDASGNVVRMIEYAIDITDRKRAEEEAAKSRARYEELYAMARLMADTLPDMIWAKDLEGRYLFANRALCERLLGATDTEEPIGKTDMFFAKRERASHPEDPEWHTFGELCMDSDAVVLQSRETRQFNEFGHVRGRFLRLMVHKAPLFDEDGRLIGTVGSARDITEEYTIQEERRLLQVTIDQAEMGVCIIDPDGTVVYTNPAYLKITDFESHELVGKNVTLLLERCVDSEIAAEILSAISMGIEWSGQIEKTRKDGTTYVEGQTIMPVYDQDGLVSHMVAYIRDVSSVVELERQYLQAQKLETVGRVAGGIAHDFNNLLGAIRAYAELVQLRVAGNPEVEADVAEILAATEHGARLTQQLLAFARRQPAAPRAIDLNRLISDFHGMLRQLICEEIELITRLESGLPPVLSDPAQIEQLLANLVINARDAMPDGGQLIIETRTEERLPPGVSASHEGSWVVLAVSDTGTGMTEEVREHIFEPFFTTKEVGRGTGLGLSTCFGIVAQSGGHIEVDTEPGAGTTMSVYLPAAGEAPGPHELEAVAADVEGGTETILLVEDEAALRHAVAKALRKLGYTVLEAEDGERALELWKTGAVDLLLSDEVMPGMTGSELARRLRTADPALPVVLISGYLDGAGGEGPAPGTVVVSKPFSLRTIAGILREVLDGSGSRGATP